MGFFIYSPDLWVSRRCAPVPPKNVQERMAVAVFQFDVGKTWNLASSVTVESARRLGRLLLELCSRGFKLCLIPARLLPSVPRVAHTEMKLGA